MNNSVFRSNPLDQSMCEANRSFTYSIECWTGRSVDRLIGDQPTASLRYKNWEVRGTACCVVYQTTPSPICVLLQLVHTIQRNHFLLLCFLVIQELCVLCLYQSILVNSALLFIIPTPLFCLLLETNRFLTTKQHKKPNHLKEGNNEIHSSGFLRTNLMSKC